MIGDSERDERRLERRLKESLLGSGINHGLNAFRAVLLSQTTSMEPCCMSYVVHRILDK